MNIPDILKIGPHIYSVSFRENITRDRGALGESCLNGLWISIDNSCPESQQEETLIHEIIEQIDSQYDLKLNHQTISTISNAFYQVLKDNKLRFD